MRSDPGRSSRRRRSVLGVAAAVVAATLVASAGPATPSAPAAAETSDASLASAAARPTLRQGARGAAVTSLQRRLTALHYDLGTADGVFGGETYHAVVAFQKVHNLGRDGVVGPATWAKLDRPLTLRP